MSQPAISFEASPGKGAYVLLFQSLAVTFAVGGLGVREFHPGWYGYIGSARGPGGFARVRRHVFLNQKKDRRAHWHIDYLLLDSHFRLDVAICGHSRTDVECLLAEQLCDSDSVPGFGSSDCACHSHLFFRKVNPCIEVISSFRDLGIAPDIKTIKNHG